MADVTMPKLSDTMEEGKLLRWLKRSGDRVEVGEILAEVETDKADMELESSVAGTIRELKLGEGESAPVGAVIAVVDGGSDGSAADAGASAHEPEERESEGSDEDANGHESDGEDAPRDEGGRQDRSGEPQGRQADAERPAGAGGQAATGPQVAAHGRSPEPARSAGASSGRARAEESRADAPERSARDASRATEAKPRAQARSAPPARAAAPSPSTPPSRGAPAERASEQTETSGERAEAGRRAGPGIVRVRPPAAARPAPAPAAEEGALRIRRVPLSRMRASIARRMAESKREAPHFYLTTTAAMDEAVRLRAALRESLDAQGAVTFNHMVLKACADALAAFPEMNARFAGDAIEVLENVNLGVAIAVEEGLLVPVIHDADRLTLFEIAARARLLGERAQGGSFSGADLSGATFSVSNLGMFGVESFAAVINPPQAGILAVGSVELRPVVRDGALATGHTMSMTLSCDHRAVDGAQGARFLADVRRRLENPLALVLGAALA